MGQNFDDYPGFQTMRSWANTYAQDCICRYVIVVAAEAVIILDFVREL